MAQDRFGDYGRGDRERERDWRGRPDEGRGGYQGRGETRSFGAERGYPRQGGYGDYGGDYARQPGESARPADFERGYSRYGGYGGYDAEGGYGGFGPDYAYGQPAGEDRYRPGEYGYGRATQRTASERGYGRQQSFRGRGPKGYRRSDERIREDVNDRLTDDHWLDASEIEIAVKNAEVTLTGAVASREDKRRAEAIVEQISGVDHVQNNLRIQAAGQAAQSTGGGQTTQQTGRA